MNEAQELFKEIEKAHTETLHHIDTAQGVLGVLEAVDEFTRFLYQKHDELFPSSNEEQINIDNLFDFISKLGIEVHVVEIDLK